MTDSADSRTDQTQSQTPSQSQDTNIMSSSSLLSTVTTAGTAEAGATKYIKLIEKEIHVHRGGNNNNNSKQQQSAQNYFKSSTQVSVNCYFNINIKLCLIIYLLNMI